MLTRLDSSLTNTFAKQRSNDVLSFEKEPPIVLFDRSILILSKGSVYLLNTGQQPRDETVEY
jgi:hypothetical protein